MNSIDNMNNLLERHKREDLITRQECISILQCLLQEQNKKGELISYDMVPELATIGYMGEYFHLHVKYRLENDGNICETRFFIKTLPYQNPGMSDFIQRSGIMSKEANIYQKLLNELRKLSPNTWCAQCYLVKSDLFVMENIVDKGYEPLKDASEFLNLAQIKSILKGLSTMHACSIGYEARNQLNIGEHLKDVLHEVTVSPKVVWYTAGIKAILAATLVHPLYQTEVIQNFIKTQLPAILDTVYEMVNPSKKYYNVFCHRDVWGGNVFFHKQQPHQKGAAFVDFQLCRYSPAAIDILMTLFMNTKPRDRLLMEPECFEFYYDSLSRELSEMNLQVENYLTFEDFQSSLKDFGLFGALYGCISATVLRVPGDYLKDMKLNRPEDFHRYTNIDRTKEVLELLKVDRIFREYLLECIEDLMELVLKNYLYEK